MADFFSAIKNSLEAAGAADRQNQEIVSMISSLNSQVLDVSKGAVGISIRKFRHTLASTFAGKISKMAKADGYFALTLSTKFQREEKSLEVAIWNQDDIGYPVEINFENNRYNCKDKISLEKVLLTIVSTAKFGTQLKNLMEHKIEEQNKII